MRSFKTAVAVGAVAGALAAGAIGMGPGMVAASADPVPPPGYPAGDEPAPDAPAKPPTPRWSPNTPVVWDHLGHRWGVYINDVFLPLH